MRGRVSVSLVKACARIRGDGKGSAESDGGETSVLQSQQLNFSFQSQQLRVPPLQLLVPLQPIQPLRQQLLSSNPLAQSHSNIPQAQSSTSLPLRNRSIAAAPVQGRARIFAVIVVTVDIGDDRSVGVISSSSSSSGHGHGYDYGEKRGGVDQRGRWGWIRKGWGMGSRS